MPSSTQKTAIRATVTCLLGRGYARELLLVSSAHGVAQHYPVSLGDQVLDLDPEVGESSVEHGDGSSKALATEHLSGDESVVDEVGGDCLVRDGLQLFALLLTYEHRDACSYLQREHLCNR